MTPIVTPLRLARQKLGKSLDQMAIETGLNKSTLSRLENGKSSCSPQVATAVSSAYGLSVDQVVQLADKPIDVLDQNIASLLEVVAELKLTTFTLRDIYFLIQMQCVIGKQLHSTLIRELLLTRDKPK